MKKCEHQHTSDTVCGKTARHRVAALGWWVCGTHARFWAIRNFAVRRYVVAVKQKPVSP